MNKFYFTPFILLVITIPLLVYGSSSESNSRYDEVMLSNEKPNSFFEAQDIVAIPDANFKSGLISLGVDTNGDGEIQYAEAENFTSQIKIAGAGISDLTGIEAFTNITDLRVHYNSLSTVDLSANVNLTQLHIQNNELNSITLNANAKLDKLRIHNNLLTSLDLNANSKFRHLEAANNQLVTVKVKNGNNNLLYKFDLMGNPNLECIEVDDVAYAEANLSAEVPAGATFSLNCAEDGGGSDGDTGIVTIPDTNFKSGLISLGVDTNGDGEIQYTEAESFTSQIKIAGAGISDLTGIEAFTNITDLRVHYNALSTVDLSANVNLTHLHVQHNQLSAIDLNANTKLDQLRIQNNQLTSLDLNPNSSLRYLEATNNQLVTVKIKNGNNQLLYKLDLMGNPDLVCVEVDDVAYAEANLSGEVPAGATFSLNCAEDNGNPDISEIVPSLNATSSTDLPLPDSEPDKSLDLVTDPGYPTYKWYKDGSLLVENTSNTLTLNNASGDLFQPSDAGDYTVVLADTEGNESLMSDPVTVTYTSSTPEGVVNIPDANFKSGLISLGVDTNGDGEIQYTEAESFTSQIKIAGAGIFDLTGIEAFTNITDLRVHYNSLSTVDLSANVNLTHLHIQNNQLSAIALNANTKLDQLRIQNNQLTSLDLNPNSSLRYLEATNNQLTTVKIKNGNNQLLYKLDLMGNPNLECVEVDDVAYAEANLSAEVPAGATFSLNCAEDDGGSGGDPDIVHIPDANFKSALISAGVDTNGDGEIQYSEAEAITGELRLLGQEISDLTGIEAFTSITDLRVHYNNLEFLDLTANTQLKELHAQNNNLSSIILGSNINLVKIRLQNNALSILDLKNQSGLRHLEASNNMLTYVSIKNGNNEAMYLFDVLDNPDLTCIEVDDVAYAEANLSDKVGPNASFQLSCGDVPEIVNVKPQITATSSTSLPLPESTADKSLDLIADSGYPNYRWYKDGALIQESASNILTLNNSSGTLFQPEDAGDYTVILADEQGNTSRISDPVTVTYDDPNGPAPFPTEFQKVELITEIKNPVNFEFAPDGRVFILDRFGEILVYDPATQTTVSAGVINVFHGLEDGLIGLQFDPDFSENNQIYLHFSPKSESVNRVSRFTMSGNQVDLTSEEIIIDWPTQRQKCCHAAGDMDMDADGNLYIATGDNTNHSKFSTLNEVDPNESSENTSSNTNDLRGKILRIKPKAGGGYTIPSGNLFPDGVGGLPEIYVMGARNPYRIFVDKENTGWLFWGEVGPDANQPGPEGPEGLDEINLTKQAGNYGWPYFSGENEPYLNTYADPNFYYDPDNPVNISTWNTGETNLPPAQPSWMDFFHECYLAGPRYYFDPSIDNPKKLPASIDEYFFYYDFNTSRVWAAELDQAGNVVSTTQMNRDVFDGAGFIDMKIGPDGQMYLLEYGAGCCPNNTGTGKLIRIDYMGIDSNSAPSVTISADKTSGSVPLTVNFTSEGTFDPDGDALTYEWDFQTDGTVDSPEQNPSFTYSTAGTYDAQLRVSDGNGGVSSKSIKIHAGNSAATFTFNHPPDGGFFNWEDHLNYDVEVNDVEDGSTTDGSIDCSDVNVVPSMGHLDHSHDALPINQCSGTFPFTISGHDNEEMDIFYVLNFSYTDNNGLTSFDQVNLHPKIKEAEHFDEQSNTQLIANTDELGGGSSSIRAAAHGSYLVFTGRNLLNINSVSYRVASSLGGTIELRTGAPDGPLLGTTEINNTGGVNNWETIHTSITDPGGKNDLYFVFKNQGNTNLFDLNYIEFMGPGVSINDTPPTVSSVSVPSETLVSIKFSEQLDENSAGNTANYSINNGINVSSASLQADDRTVFLTISPLAAQTNYQLTISNVANDNGVPLSNDIVENISFGSAKTALIRINSGGQQEELDGTTWHQDQYNSGGKTYTNNIADILNTSIDELYRTERYSNFNYSIPVPEAGLYDVNLHFAEIYFGVQNSKGIGARVFNVDIESGQAGLTDYDIIEQAGGPATAIIEKFKDISVEDGFLTITFTGVVENPKISGIEVFGSNTSQGEPSIAIQSPSDGSQVVQPFDLVFKVENWEVGEQTTHIHLMVDGEKKSGVYTTDPVTLTDLSLGSHTIELVLAEENHSLTTYSDQITVEIVDEASCGNEPFPDQWARETIVVDEHPYRSVFIYSEDMDGDGLNDIVSGGWWYKNPGTPTGNWQQNVIGAPMNNMSLIFDIDKDGDPDIFGTQGMYESAEMAWAENDGNGNFTIHTNIPAGTSTYHETFMSGAALGNFNAGTAMQIAITWNGGENGHSDVQMLTIPSDPVNQSWAIETISPESYGEAITAGDIDNDGDLDLFQAINWLRNDNGSWTSFSTGISIPTTQERSTLADLNQNGRLDGVLTQIGIDQDIYWIEAPSDPTQSWTLRTIGNDIDAGINLDVVDIDFDGDLDVLTAEWKNARRLIAFENDLCNTGTWVRHVLDPGGDGRDHHDGAQSVDIDNDGDFDIISIGWDNIRPRIYINNSAVNEQAIPASNTSLAYTPEFAPELQATNSTELPLPDSSTDQSLELVTVKGYPKYYWYKDGVLIEEGNTSKLRINDKWGNLFNPSSDTGTYSVEVADKYGTKSRSSAPVSITYVSPDELNRITSVTSVYPNPFTEAIKIAFSDNSYENESMVLYDLEGKTIKSIEVKDHKEITFDLSDLAPGVYMLQIKNEKYKLIKSRN